MFKWFRDRRLEAECATIILPVWRKHQLRTEVAFGTFSEPLRLQLAEFAEWTQEFMYVHYPELSEDEHFWRVLRTTLIAAKTHDTSMIDAELRLMRRFLFRHQAQLMSGR